MKAKKKFLSACAARRGDRGCAPGLVGRVFQCGLALTFALVAAAPDEAHAAAYACTGKVDQVSTGPGGDVNASFAFATGRMDWQVLCNVSDVYNNVPVAACKSMLATLLSARLAQRDVMLWFDNASGGSCNATAWRSLREAGWYWGPSIQ